MNMHDTKKCFRGVLLWREDVLKCAKIIKKPLSGFVRELLHAEMEKHRLTEADNRILRAQIAEAFERRGQRKVVRNAKRGITIDRVNIPAKVRQNPKFVKGE